jgi:transcriptional regulator with XRE-family HTH domain
MTGGPPHQDMYDLKTEAPAEIRGPFQPIDTAVPGIQVCEHLPRIAGLMDKLVPIRSMVGSDGGHSQYQWDHSDTIGGRIARAREAARLSVAQAARRLGVKTATWQGWENDRAEPRSNKLLMMAGTFSVSPTWLLSGYGNGPTEVIDEEVQVLRQELKSVAQDVASAQTRLNAVLERLETFYSYHHVEPS